MWNCYKSSEHEIKILAMEIFPKSCIKDVEETTDHLGRKCWSFRTINICPDLFFNIPDAKQKYYWQIIDQRMRDRNSLAESWKDFFHKAVPAALFNIQPKQCKIIGKQIYINNYQCKFVLPLGSPRPPVSLEDIVWCNSCLKLGHNTRQWLTQKKRRKNASEFALSLNVSRSLRDTIWAQLKENIKGACMNCGRYGHEQDKCEHPKYCRRCHSNTHSSRITLECPKVRSRLGHLKRHQSLQILLQCEIPQNKLIEYIDWFNGNTTSPQKIDKALEEADKES